MIDIIEEDPQQQIQQNVTSIILNSSSSRLKDDYQSQLLHNDEEEEEEEEEEVYHDNSKDVDTTKTKTTTTSTTSTPMWCYVILVTALLAMSSSGVALSMIDAPPLLKASWRLQSTSLILFIGFLYDLHSIYPIIQHNPFMVLINKVNQLLVYQYQIIDKNHQISILLNKWLSSSILKSTSSSIQEKRDSKKEIRNRYFSRKTIGLLVSTGIMLGLHFGFWVSSLSTTSLSHSLLFVTSSPIMVVIVMVITRKPISKFEIIGCFIGFIGLVVTLFDALFLNTNTTGGDSSIGSNSNSSIDSSLGEDIKSPTLYGDLLALLGAVCIVFYLFAGSSLRSWVSLYLYVFPVTFLASVFLSIASAIFEDISNYGGTFGWFGSSFFWLTVYVAVGPGIIGHTGMNAIIKYVEPVVISVTLLLESPIGTLMGWSVGVSGVPGLYTFLGGPIVIIGCGMVTLASYKRTKQQQKEKEEKERKEEEEEETDKVDKEEDDGRAEVDNQIEMKQILENISVNTTTTNYDEI